MSPSSPTVVALAHEAPCWLRREATLDRVVARIAAAGAEGARLIAFGEAFVPGYPFWLEHTDAARFDSTFQKRLFAHYAMEAVQIERGDLKPVCDAARRHGIWVVLGIIERPRDRAGHSLYCSLVIIDAGGAIRNVHRKLVPTYEERLAWSPGDGHGLRAFAFGDFTLGALNCWENWMPLARSALYAQGVDLHVAIWPGNVRNTQDISRFVAREGRSYVLSVGGRMAHEDIDDALPFADELRARLPPVCAEGGACIAGPDGEWLLPPQDGPSALLIAELDPRRVFEERQNFDPFGHYSRPDVLEVHVDRRRRNGFVADEGGLTG